MMYAHKGPLPGPPRGTEPSHGAAMCNEFTASANGADVREPRTFNTVEAEQAALVEEIKTCRSIANRCAFVLGPARSGTTILAQLVNTSDRAYLTTEANLYQAGHHPDFREWYNHQHLLFENQISKMSYAAPF